MVFGVVVVVVVGSGVVVVVVVVIGSGVVVVVVVVVGSEVEVVGLLNKLSLLNNSASLFSVVASHEFAGRKKCLQSQKENNLAAR